MGKADEIALMFFTEGLTIINTRQEDVKQVELNTLKLVWRKIYIIYNDQYQFSK